MEAIEVFFQELFNNNPFVATIIISMFPATEARLGIPFGMNTALWGANALTSFQALLCGFLGSSIVVPIIALLFKPVLKWAKKIKGINKLFYALENKLNYEKNSITTKGDIVFEKQNNKNKLKLIFGVFLFVATPLPLTGVYTGTMLGVILNLGFLNTCLTVICGNLFACLLVAGVSSLINTTYIILGVLISLVVILLSKQIKRKKSK